MCLRYPGRNVEKTVCYEVVQWEWAKANHNDSEWDPKDVLWMEQGTCSWVSTCTLLHCQIFAHSIFKES